MLQVEWSQDQGALGPLVPAHRWIRSERNEKEPFPVSRGNLVKPREAQSDPQVSWSAPASSLWTLAMVGPDSHLSQPGKEVGQRGR